MSWYIGEFSSDLKRKKHFQSKVFLFFCGISFFPTVNLTAISSLPHNTKCRQNSWSQWILEDSVSATVFGTCRSKYRGLGISQRKEFYLGSTHAGNGYISTEKPSPSVQNRYCNRWSLWERVCSSFKFHLAQFHCSPADFMMFSFKVR